MTTYEGRLELTWTNKDLRLLAHEDGSYEWLSPADYRVAEVRLLHDAATVGSVGRARAADNLLIQGDALNALTSLSRLPEFAAQYLGKVKLAYIDPPFNTQQSFLHYDDALEHSVWLTMMRDRIVQIKDLLSENGSLWVHCDDSEQGYLRVVLDEIFGRENFVTTIAWEKAQGARNDTDISSAHDYIIVYARDHQVWKKQRNLLPRSDAQIARYKNPDNDPRGPWRQGENGTAKSGSDDNRFPITIPSGRDIQPPRGTYWRFSKDTFERLRADNRIYFGADGDSAPVIKRFLSELQDGVVPRTWWPASEVGSNQEAKRDHFRQLFPDIEPFATPKPERLMQRIVHIATDPGDIVLDCFAGSGTTAAVAHKMGRRWVAIEREAETIKTFTLPRLEKVVAGEDPGGITTVEISVDDDLPVGLKSGQARTAAKVLNALLKAEALDRLGDIDEETVSQLVKALRQIDKTKAETMWGGGGGFRVLGVAASMFEAEEGLVFLADWMTNGSLAEATAAQLGFAYDEDPPFSGRKGRTRLAVVDGIANESVVRILHSALPEGEKVVVCGTGIDTDARPVLRELRPGSTLRKIPAALLDEYRSARQLSLALADDGPSEPASNGATPAVAAKA
jgi:adenine-specific DNA-methyltransferase